jgi:hypothetical protein
MDKRMEQEFEQLHATIEMIRDRMRSQAYLLAQQSATREEMTGLGADFFNKAVLTRAGDSVVETMGAAAHAALVNEREPTRPGHTHTCEHCGSRSILHVTGKTSDRCCVTYGKHRSDGYVPEDISIGGGDYLEFSLCMQCGRVQHFEPKTPSQIHKSLRDA